LLKVTLVTDDEKLKKVAENFVKTENYASFGNTIAKP